MKKRLIFRYKDVLIKTQRKDKGGQVSQLIRWLLSSEVGGTGKSVTLFNERSEWESKEQSAGKRNSSAFKKSFVGEHVFSVPQTDTGALVGVHQGKRATVVQGTRQQKLGVTFGRCPARAWHGNNQITQ